MRRSRLFVLLLLSCCILVSGCWDKVEIEDRLFVLAIGADKTDASKNPSPGENLTLTFVSPIAAATKGGEGPAFKTYKTVNNNLTTSLVQLLSRFAKAQFFGHTRVMVFGEDLLKDEQEFKELIDALKRSHEMHRSILVFVVPGKASDAFEVKPLYDRLLATYMTGIADNILFTDRVLKETLFELLVSLENHKGNVIIPRMMPSKDEVKISGAGIIKDYRLIGYLSEQDGTAQNWLTGDAKGGTVPVTYRGIDMVFRYFTFGRKITLDKVENGKYYLTYHFETEGSVEEYIEGSTLLDDKLLRELEKLVQDKIEKDSLALIRKYQQEYKVDLIGAGDYMMKHRPALYDRMEKDFEKQFSDNMVFNVKATAKIRRVGLSK